MMTVFRSQHVGLPILQIDTHIHARNHQAHDTTLPLIDSQMMNIDIGEARMNRLAITRPRTKRPPPRTEIGLTSAHSHICSNFGIRMVKKARLMAHRRL